MPIKTPVSCDTMNRFFHKPLKFHHTRDWAGKTWNGTAYMASWMDGINCYAFRGAWGGYILNGDTWRKLWSEVLVSGNVWTDGKYIYHSYHDSDSVEQYVLDRGEWKPISIPWNITIDGQHIWTDGERIYHSRGTVHHVLNDGIWWETAWNGVSNFYASDIWTDGTNVYMAKTNGTAMGKDHYILRGDTWEKLDWYQDFAATTVWTDGFNIYSSYFKSAGNYVYYILKGGKWEEIEWSRSDFSFANVWTDGVNVYAGTEFVLTATIVDPMPIYRFRDGWEKQTAYQKQNGWWKKVSTG